MRFRHKVVAAAGAAGTVIAPACSPAPAAHRGSTTTSASPRADAGPDATVASSVTTSAEPTLESAGAGTIPPAPAGPTTTAYVITVPTNPPTTTTIRPRPIPPTTNPEYEDEGLTDEEWWEAQPGHQAPVRDVLLACIRSYEQNDNPRKGPTGYASDTGNGFYGAYQFDLSTWRSVGGSGNPAHASPAEQDARAWALYLSRGLRPWPTPDARCAG